MINFSNRYFPLMCAKRLLLLSILIFSITGIYAQVSTTTTGVPLKFNYSTQIVDSTGIAISNAPITMRGTIHSGSPTGPALFSELYTNTTSPNGIFTVVVGGGTSIQGNIGSLPWSSGNLFFQVEMDPTGTSSFVNMGTAQLISQPYSLVSGNGVDSVDLDSTGHITIRTTNGQTVISSLKRTWLIGGNSGLGSTDYIGTNDATDVVVKRNSVEQMRIGENKTTISGNVGIGTATPLTALDVNGAVALRDTSINSTGNISLNTSRRSLFTINTFSPQPATCTLSNGLVTGQLLMIMVNKGNNNDKGVTINSTSNINIGGHGNITLKDGGVISFVWNGTKWLETSSSN